MLVADMSLALRFHLSEKFSSIPVNQLVSEGSFTPIYALFTV